MVRKRPKHLNLFKIRLPITGVASINHRLSGVILFVSIPLSLYFLQLSLQSTEGFRQVKEYLTASWVLIPGMILLWSFLHHLFAGFRFLFIDMNMGSSLPVARKTAWLVIIAAITVTVIVTGWWLV